MADKKLAIIATKGPWTGLPAVHSGSTAAALGYETQIFSLSTACSFSERNSTSGQPARQPGHANENAVRPKWFKGINWNIPNACRHWCQATNHSPPCS